MRLLWRANRRFLWRHRGQTLLALLCVALGVAVITAIDLTRASARESFLSAARQLNGQASHRIHARHGTIPDALYVRLRTELGVTHAAPVVSGYVRHAVPEGAVWRVLGIDPLAEAPFRRQGMAPTTQPGATLRRFLAEPGVALFSGTDAAAWQQEHVLPLHLPDGTLKTIHLLGHLPASHQNLLLMDIASAQELLAQQGLDHIDLILPSAAAVEEIRRWLPPTVTLEPAAARDLATLRLSRAFELNLQTLGLLALAIGLLLIFNTVTLNLQRRKLLLARLRAMGVPRPALLRLLLGEVAGLGLCATLLGLLAGYLLALPWQAPVSATLNRFYYNAPGSPELMLTYVPFLKGLACGLGGSLLATWLPIRALLRQPLAPQLRRISQEQQVWRQRQRQRSYAAGCALAALLLLAWRGSGMYGGLLALAGLLLACALLAPDLVRVGSRLFSALLRHQPLRARLGPTPLLASRDCAGHLSRTGLAVMALLVAMSTSSGMTLLVDSFRHTVSQWLSQRLSADLYLRPVPWTPGSPPSLAPSFIEQVRTLPGVAALYTLSSHALFLPDGRRLQLTAMELPPQARHGYRFKRGEAEQAWQAFDQAQAALISEPLAYHLRLKVGDALQLPTPQGLHAFTVAGIFFDYASDTGRVLISGDLYRRLWGAYDINASGLYLTPDADPARLRQRLQQLAAQTPLEIRPARQLLADALAVFDHTFLITHAMRLIALGVAVLGLFGTLQSLLLERGRELGTLRALGLLPQQMTALLLWHAGLLGLLTGALAVPVGLLLAWLLSAEVNMRSFGWSIELLPAHLPLLETLGLSVLAALLAALYPAWRYSRQPLADTLRGD